ncbi:YvrJ family protein [Sporosarcina sp. Sa2YVA2]|uniref:YvrJ family protein n=1 Tax=Sporosarcina quadrami TaxID=2762234 RepID=A0ABR8U7K5_9BACL|nr:YvrJ family protein [Sporosarcina quadrami]MBD7983775.1 YvrJ family protein [Sporosarcina quadrami]
MQYPNLERGCRKLNEESMNLISNLGFPIAVAVYLLIRFEKKIGMLETAINKLTIILSSKEKK